MWNGGDRDILLSQEYSAVDDYQHISWLAQAFQDPRYIRIDGRPLFLVYQTADLPDPGATARRWREEARQLGVGELFLCRVERFGDPGGDPRQVGFDAAVEFPPDLHAVTPGLGWRLGRRLTKSRWRYRHQWIPYEAVVRRSLAKPAPSYVRFPGVTPALPALGSAYLEAHRSGLARTKQLPPGVHGCAGP